MLLWLGGYFRGLYLDEIDRDQVDAVATIKNQQASSLTANRYSALDHTRGGETVTTGTTKARGRYSRVHLSDRFIEAAKRQLTSVGSSGSRAADGLDSCGPGELPQSDCSTVQ